MRILIVAALVGLTSCGGPRYYTVLWQNGGPGRWGGSGGSAATVNVADSIGGGTPSAQFSCTSSPCSFSTAASTKNPGADYKEGHLVFHIRLEAPNISAIRVELSSPFSVEVPVASLSSSAFTRVSIPFTQLYGTNGPGGSNVTINFNIKFEATVGQAGAVFNGPVATVNYVIWSTY